jgi:hypothetical protein
VLLIEAIALVTNSTVTTTVSQQTSAWSLAEIINYVTAAATVVLAVYAGITIAQARKNRILDEYDKELVNLFNPMSVILSRAELRIDPYIGTIIDNKCIGQYQSLTKTDVEKLREIFTKYGHYLTGSHYYSIQELIFLEKELDNNHLIFPMDPSTSKACGLDEHVNWGECFALVDTIRPHLIAESLRLQRSWF